MRASREKSQPRRHDATDPTHPRALRDPQTKPRTRAHTPSPTRPNNSLTEPTSRVTRSWTCAASAKARMARQVPVRWRVAALYVAGPLSAPPANIYLWLNSTQAHLMQPLAKAGAEVDVVACLDQANNATALPTMMVDILHARLWWMGDACEGLEGRALQCCASHSNDCDYDFAERSRTWQWYRLLSCYNRLMHEPRQFALDFVIRARVDLWWVANLNRVDQLLALGSEHITLRYKSACHLDESITLGHLQQAYYKIGPRMCSDTNPPACDELDYSCATYDDQFAIVPARLADTYFKFAVRRLTPPYVELRKVVRRCTGWRLAEGRLTEYLLANATSVNLISLPMELAGATIRQDRRMPPWLILGESDWDPATQIRCALSNESWGVGAWLLQANLLNESDGSEMQALTKRLSRAFIMKHVHSSGSTRERLLKFVPESKHVQFDRALQAYAARYLIRRPTQSYRIDSKAVLQQFERQRTSLTGSGISSSPPAPPTTPTRPHPPVVASKVELTFVVQYWHHPRQLPIICARLQDPRVEIIVHADSNSSDDHAAFVKVLDAYSNLRILNSDNVHEVRGYNMAASIANGWLLAFSQDDRLPPEAPDWVDSVLGTFQLLPKLGMLGLHRGSPLLLARSGNLTRREQMYGTCGDARDQADSGTKWHGLVTRDMDVPLMMVSWINLGPIVVRRRLFLGLGGFNVSYSKPGELGIGFDGELTGRVIAAGQHAALVCPSRGTYFRNGCGGKGTTSTRAKQKLRLGLMNANEHMFTEQFQADEPSLLAKVRDAQSMLSSSKATLDALAKLFPNCSRCSSGKGIDSGFHKSDHLCGTANGTQAA